MSIGADGGGVSTLIMSGAMLSNERVLLYEELSLICCIRNAFIECDTIAAVTDHE